MTTIGVFFMQFKEENLTKQGKVSGENEEKIGIERKYWLKKTQGFKNVSFISLWFE